MRKIIRNQFDNDENWSIQHDALLLPKNVVVYADDHAISFEQFEIIEENAEVVNVDSKDTSVKVFHFDDPALIKLTAKIGVEKLLNMTFLQAVTMIFDCWEEYKLC
jgi:hypothetical protein